MDNHFTKLFLGFKLGSFRSKLTGIKTSVAVTYFPSRNNINALFLGEVTEGLDWVERDLELYKPLTDNPFLLPFLLCQRFAEAIGESLDEQFDLLHQIEMDSGQTRILLIDEMGRVIPKRSGHEQDLSLEVLGVIQLAVAIETSARGHLITIDSVKAELLRFPWPETSKMDLQHRKEQHKIIEKRLDLVSQMVQLAVLRTENLKQRASEQETAVRSINTDSRR